MAHDLEKDIMSPQDVEQPVSSDLSHGMSIEETTVQENVPIPNAAHSAWVKLLNAGVELRGMQPVPPELRTDTRYLNACTIFLCSMTSLLPFSVGSAVPIVFGLGLRDSVLMIIFFNLIFIIPAAYLITLGPITGMRQMVQSRYAFGKWANTLPTLVLILTVGGFACTATIVAGQCFSYMSDGRMSTTVGMLVIVCICVVVSFFGYHFLHAYVRWAWIPVFIAILFIIGVAGSDLTPPPVTAPATARQILGVIAMAGGSQITWAMFVSDYCVYMPATTPRPRIAFYLVFGICFPYTVFQIVAAAIGCSITRHPTWAAAYGTYGIGGVLGAILDKVPGFGRFVLCVMALSAISTVSRDYYTVSVNLQVMIPILHKVPRNILAVVAAGAAYGISVAASRSFYSSLVTFLSVIGYFGASWVSVTFIEWFYFRKADPASYDPAIWNDAKKLPSGIPGLIAVTVPWALIVPSMDQTWYAGPIAKAAGDLGVWFAFIIAALLYYPLRAWEIKRNGGLLQGNY